MKPSPSLVVALLIVASSATGILPGCSSDPPGNTASDAATASEAGGSGSQGTPDGASASTTDGASSSTSSQGWLATKGNHIVQADGTPWHGRGANIHDTRSCNACTFAAPDVAEVERRIDELVDNWHATALRFDLESYASAGGRTQWQSVVDDAGYLADVQTIVAHIASKGVYALVSLWADGTFTSQGWPTDATNAEWTKLSTAFAHEPHVLYGICNEPQNNFDGSQDPEAWAAINSAAAAIRSVEDAMGTPHHIITAQGTGGWARRLDYYVTHPITAGGGDNIAYEVHVYDPQSSFQTEFVNAAATLPVVIGEFGPASNMTQADIAAMVQQAESLGIPHFGWTFHMRCPPNLLDDDSNGGCGVGMPLTASSPWGTFLKSALAQPWP